MAATALAVSMAHHATAQDTSAVRSASVTYISGTSIYVSAGRTDGLVEGQELSVVRHDSTAATLKVVFLSSRQSSCEVVRGATDIAVGDLVRFTPSASNPAGTRV